MRGGGLSGVQPVAQAIVLRRVLMGGISMNSGCLVYALSSTDAFGCPGTAGCGLGGLVFGTLLGPEATGPGGSPLLGGLSGFVCFWFPGCADRTVDPFLGLCVGCVVWGCCLRTT